MKISKLACLAAGMILSGTFALSANAGVTVSTGYYDLPPPDSGNPSALPNPWYGSPNTIFDGNSVQAQSGDPDEAGVLIHNATSQAVTLTAFSIVSSTNTWTIWNSNIGTGQTIAAGGNLIFSGNNQFSMDGSDGGLNNSTVFWTINGVAGSAKDVTINNGTDISLGTGVLTGSIHGSGNETLPWVQIANISPVPEPETYAMMLAGLGLTGFMVRSKKTA